MKKVIKKENAIKPAGIYGGEANAENPINWTLRSTISAQLRALGWFCVVDSFGDRSASWIEVYKENPKEKKEGKLSSFTIQFNYDGTIISNVRFFEQDVYVKIGESRCVL